MTKFAGTSKSPEGAEDLTTFDDDLRQLFVSFLVGLTELISILYGVTAAGTLISGGPS